MTSREAFNKWYDSLYKGIAYTLKDDMEAAWQAGREALLTEIKAKEVHCGLCGVTKCYQLPEGEQ